VRTACEEEVVIEAALELAETGVAVFPVGPDKAPRTANGFHDATTDAEAIQAWTEWDGGIGAAVPDGFVVIDVDPRNGGTDTLKLLAEAGRKLPRTRTARTRSGGFHYWLSVPTGATLRSKLGPGVDVKRAGKGYVVVPPSAGYVWLPGPTRPPRRPEWLLEELLVRERPRAAEASEAKFFSWDDGTAYGLAAMERELGRLAMAQEGGGTTRSTAPRSPWRSCRGRRAQRERARTRCMRWRSAHRPGLRTRPRHRHLGLARRREGAAAGAGARGRCEGRTVRAAGQLSSGGGTLQRKRPRDLWVDWEVDEPPLPFYIHPVLPKNAYVLVYGATEASKSMVWVALCAEASQRGSAAPSTRSRTRRAPIATGCAACARAARTSG
jgi:hypothetical protein